MNNLENTVAEKSKAHGYVPLTYHGLEQPKLHHKPLVPYYKFMSIEERVEKCRKSFGKQNLVKGQGKD